MNIFRVLASGRHPFREEFVSAFVAYLLSPKMDHGLGPTLLATLLREIGRHANVPALAEVARQFDHRLRDNLFGDPAQGVSVELELPYPAGNSIGFIDVVIRCGQWFIAIENKIAAASATPGQVREQYLGLKQVLQRRGLDDQRVLVIYLVPALRSSEGWSVSQTALDELGFALDGEDCAALVTWQPTREGTVSFIEIIRSVLQQESRGEIAPLSYDIRQSLLAFIDFALGEFLGYPYDRPVDGETPSERRVADLLRSVEPVFVGIQYGMAGVLRRAWKNPGFVNEVVPVSETSRGWQYLPLHDFKVLAEWAMSPETQSLSGIKWSGRPFWTPHLYLVAKASGSEIYVGMRGGIEALRRMAPDEIRQRRTWEVSDQKRSGQWFSGADFCAVLESKGITYDRVVDGE